MTDVLKEINWRETYIPFTIYDIYGVSEYWVFPSSCHLNPEFRSFPFLLGKGTTMESGRTSIRNIAFCR